MRIGIFGGTFNPIHSAHLTTARGALTALALDRVLLMVAADPPHKAVAGAVPGSDRLRMARLAADGVPGLAVSDLELRREGKSYTVDTLRALHEAYPGSELFLIVGSDMLQDIPAWREPAELLRLAAIAAVPRGGYAQEDAAAAALLRGDYGARVIPLPLRPPALSSTEIRRRLFAGLPVTGMLPPAVEDEVYDSGLYFPEEVRKMQEKCRLALNIERYRHTMAVVREAARLAERYGVDAGQARIAALLHDCAKCMDKGLLRVLAGDDCDIPAVLHAFAGAVVAQNDYGVRDPAVLRAIRLHSTGEAGMSRLAMLTYLADITEHTRAFPGVAALRAAVEEGLVAGMRHALSHTLARLSDRGLVVHPATERAARYFANLQEE